MVFVVVKGSLEVPTKMFLLAAVVVVVSVQIHQREMGVHKCNPFHCRRWSFVLYCSSTKGKVFTRIGESKQIDRRGGSLHLGYESVNSQMTRL